ncbi:MAG: outer membrane lipoprotein carrier protein LolA [Rickettsiales bacterium]|nr:outer membrane lipoprotein carrier protein LolA [Rickettsiales bacterium]
MKQKEVQVALVQQVFKKLFFLLLFSANCFAASENLIDVENYLNGIKYIKANFIQDDKINSQLAEGVFYISRPGKLRLDYLNPFEASLYTNNKLTVYYDKELDEISNIKTSSTPLYFLLKDKISLSDKDIEIINFEETKKNIQLTLKETDKENQGTLILKFTKNPIELNSMTLINELDQETEITLFDINKSPIKSSVFKFENPRLKKKI